MFPVGTVQRTTRLGCVPRYFFRLCDDLDCEDPEGLELPDLHAAHEGHSQHSINHR